MSGDELIKVIDHLALLIAAAFVIRFFLVDL